MNAPTDPFYFDKTDLFKKIKNIESVLGLGSFDIEEVVLRLDSIEATLNAINTSYTTKTYVDNRLLSKVSKSGDSMLGNLALLTNPVDDNHLVHVSVLVLLLASEHLVDSVVYHLKLELVEVDSLLLLDSEDALAVEHEAHGT